MHCNVACNHLLSKEKLLWCLPVCLDIPVLSIFLTEIDSASSVPTLKSFKGIFIPFFRYRDMNTVGRESTKQGAIGLMTREKGVSSSELQAPNNCECPRCTGLWQILISSSSQLQHDMHHGNSGTQRHTRLTPRIS